MSLVHGTKYIRYVHKPYIRPDKYSIATPRKPFDYTRLYRVLTEDYASGTVVDISSAVTTTTKDDSTTKNVVRMFYVGAESDLDRYLRWLNNVALLDEAGAPKPLYVIEQAVSDYLVEKEHLIKRGNHCIVLFPGQMDEFDILVSFIEDKKRRISIY